MVVHKSVLKKECLEFLMKDVDPRTPTLFADLTFGEGGHSRSILEYGDNCYVTAVDQDLHALEQGMKMMKEKVFKDRLKIFDINFKDFSLEVKNCKDLFHGFFLPPYYYGGILLDLGVSSYHFDSPERGFSFRFKGALDMRMNDRSDSDLTAHKVVNTFSEEELSDLIWKFGEEQFSRRIARVICESRSQKTIETTSELENIIFHCYPKKMRHGRRSPATKTFQALRIFVNDELNVLQQVLPTLPPLLTRGGKILVISFHSLEDRIVKRSFKEMERSDIECKILTKRPLTPQDEEISENFRSKSAKMRIIQRI